MRFCNRLPTRQRLPAIPPTNPVHVSVVIPLYNKAPYIRRTLDSIAVQHYKDFEVIVVDDGSTDGGDSIVKAYEGIPIKLITQLNAGPGAARNRGLSEASGELVAFLDADDEWSPDYLREGVRVLAENPDAASVTFGYFAFPAGKSTEAMWRARGLTEGVQRLTPDTNPMLAVQMLAYMSPCTTIARTEVIRKWGGFYNRDRCLYGEDAHLWLKVLLNEQVVFSLRPLANLHAEHSELAHNLSGARPVEPFLRYPEEIRNVCPQHLTGLLEQILAVRAFKTACVLGFWGHWREAGEFVRKFHVPDAWRLRYYKSALVCRTPLGPVIGKLWRTVLSIRN